MASCIYNSSTCSSFFVPTLTVRPGGSAGEVEVTVQKPPRGCHIVDNRIRAADVYCLSTICRYRQRRSDVIHSLPSQSNACVPCTKSTVVVLRPAPVQHSKQQQSCIASGLININAAPTLFTASLAKSMHTGMLHVPNVQS